MQGNRAVYEVEGQQQQQANSSTKFGVEDSTDF